MAGEMDPVKSGEPLRGPFSTNPSVNTFRNGAISDADVALPLAWVTETDRQACAFVVRCSWAPLRCPDLDNFVLMTWIKIVELIPT